MLEKLGILCILWRKSNNSFCKKMIQFKYFHGFKIKYLNEILHQIRI